MLIKTTFKDSKQVKKNKSVFLDVRKVADFREKNADVSRTQGVCDVFIYFFNVLKVRYANFHYCRICVTDFREGSLFAPYP